MTRFFQSRTCTSDDCGLRFPVDADSPLGERCPRCGLPTQRDGAPYRTHGVAPTDFRPLLQLEILLDNVRSLTNVGSIFRTADGAGVAHMHLGGITPTPDHPKLAKTALGAEKWIPWTHHPDPVHAAEGLVEQGARLWALEGGPASTSLFDRSLRGDALPGRLVLVLGHEVSGVDPRIVNLCDRTLYIPMLGGKDSLNVSVAMGVASYVLRFGDHQPRS